MDISGHFIQVFRWLWYYCFQFYFNNFTFSGRNSFSWIYLLDNSWNNI